MSSHKIYKDLRAAYAADKSAFGMRVAMPWPDGLKRLCSDDCAERGERACWQVDEECERHHASYPMRGTVCEDCWAAWSRGGE